MILQKGPLQPAAFVPHDNAVRNSVLCLCCQMKAASLFVSGNSQIHSSLQRLACLVHAAHSTQVTDGLLEKVKMHDI